MSGCPPMEYAFVHHPSLLEDPLGSHVLGVYICPDSMHIGLVERPVDYGHNSFGHVTEAPHVPMQHITQLDAVGGDPSLDHPNESSRRSFDDSPTEALTFLPLRR